MADETPPDTRPVLEAVLFDAGGTLVRIDYEWIADMLAEYGHIVTAGEVRRGELMGRRRYDGTVRAPRALAPGEPHPPLGSAATRVRTSPACWRARACARRCWPRRCWS